MFRDPLILAVDPGVKSGLAFFGLPEREPARLLRHVQVGGGVEGFLEYIDGPHRTWPSDVSAIVCEDFHDDGRTPNPDLTPLEFKGALQSLQYFYRPMLEDVFDLVFRLNAQGKLQMKDHVLRRGGYHPRRGEVGEGHSRDAIRVGLSYIVNVLNHRPTQLKLFPKED